MRSTLESLFEARRTRGDGRVDTTTLPAAIVVVAAAYYLGAKVGFLLTFEPHPISILWPPNSILLAALLLAPKRWWAWLLAGALVAHVLAELTSGVPMRMTLCWFVSNAAEALIGATLARWMMPAPYRLDSVVGVCSFFVCAAVAAPLLSSFLDAAFVKLNAWGTSGYWQVWSTRVVSNMLTTLTIVPVIVTWAYPPAASWMKPSRRLEAAILVSGLIAVCAAIFNLDPSSSNVASALLYLPLPFLLWAALRFGPQGMSAAYAIFVLSLIWGTGHGGGPFVADIAAGSAFSVQIFLISLAVPLLFVAALMRERTSVETELRASEELFAKAFRASPDAIVISRRSDGCIIDVNDRGQALLGYARGEIVGTSWSKLPVCASDGARGQLLSVLDSRSPARNAAVELRARSGTILTILCSSMPVDIGGEACVVAILRDVTEQIKTETEAREQRKQLVHLLRVARLSELSGALAHELNQPLASILSNAQAAQRFLKHDPPDIGELGDILSDIVEADKRAGQVIHGLRALTKRGESDFEAVDLNDVVRNALILVNAQLVMNDVRVTTRLGTDLPRLSANGIQLQQLLLNLASNACDAMQAVGRAQRKLVIETRAASNGTVELAVADSGPGLTTEQLQRLFEPFYTTKENGLGLGLSISRLIMEGHGGSLRAGNTAQGGACFRAVFRKDPNVLRFGPVA